MVCWHPPKAGSERTKEVPETEVVSKKSLDRSATYTTKYILLSICSLYFFAANNYEFPIGNIHKKIELYPLFILKEKNCQTISPGTLNMFYILVIHIDNAKVSSVFTALCPLGGAAINFSKSP